MVSLRESAYGGTTAIVRLPFGVVVREVDATPVAEDAWVIPDGLEPARSGDGTSRARVLRPATGPRSTVIVRRDRTAPAANGTDGPPRGRGR